jgi:hypothetical protein
MKNAEALKSQATPGIIIRGEQLTASRAMGSSSSTMPGESNNSEKRHSNS